jgi:hypothetical protein
MKKTLTSIVLTTLLLVCACERHETATVSPANFPVPSSTPPTPPEEPLWERSPEKFRDRWVAFTKDGRYRMARRKEVGGMPYHYSWENDVLVIVVDQILTDNSRLKLAYFKAPDTDRGLYKLYWVEHNFNLANSRVSNASSTLVIYEGGDPARRAARLKWDAASRKYTCMGT